MRVSSASSTPPPPAFAAAAWAVVLLAMLRSDVALAAAASSNDDTGLSPLMPPPPPLAAPVPAAVSPAPATPPAVLSPRKLLRPPGADVVGVGFVSGSGGGGGGGGGGDGVRTRRVDDGCAGADDIAIYQGRATPLPSGVPAYTVDVMNRCAGGGGGGGDEECAIAGIHVRCGWFSSVSLVDPRVFRRLGHDDCLLNDGRPLLAGETVSFEYTNSFPYKLSVSVATCVVDPAAP
ncbi:hypothetical protein OsI_38285 [Oryza sativa Indica Group]|uniref:Uncharacterized protein n=1 Tax=Oryza sativa subsp. indica TaxID=39946 RepID=B8BPK6_ORYSI|nr:hypothetical protein OsI_38285 [Oryza sativa Indica Group]